ncbi:MAG TPA: right-handed parallel beta-helix repeat-containing protein [Labilithrix sp.]|nr:right-handed parallel beta-helix repeat-containing protein [Labilithrix sp.]
MRSLRRLGGGWGKLTAVAALVAAAVAACGDASDDVAPPGSEGGAGTDGPGVNDPDATASDGPRPIDPGGDGGPGVTDLKCPSLVMPAAASVYVDGAATGAEAGTQAAPFRTLAKALASASAKGVIWIAAGTYKENLVVPNKDLVVYGGFAPGFASRTDACATILEAASASQPVLSASAAVKSFGLDGLTVQKGSRGLDVSGDSSVKAVFTIANAVFAENGKTGEEGGGASFDRVSAKITRSVFHDNRASKGAAVACVGDVSITIEESLFERNIGYADHGGGLYLSPTTGTIVRNTFRGNEIGKGVGYGWGGAVIVFKAGAAPVKTDFAYNVFTDNLAGIGGAVFVDDGASITMSHDLIYRNRSYRENGVARGGALYADGLSGPGTGSTLVGDHLTVAFNALDETGQPATMTRGEAVYVETYSRVTFTSSIFWSNGSDALFGDPTTTIAVSYAVAPSTCAGGATCTIGAGVFEPPEVAFVDDVANDYHEKSTAGHFAKGTWVIDNESSPAIDKADPASGAGGEPAPNGGRANLGAYGRTGEASKSP